MSFSLRARQVCLVTAALLIGGCGIHLGEKAPQEGVISYNGAGYSCVGEIPQHIEKYISDEMSEGEISDYMRCLQKSFTSFAQLTRGRDESTYAPDEIRRFLESYFIKDRKISDQLLYEFMVIKQALVGGDIQRIARPELLDAVDFLEDIRLEAIRLKPHLKYLNPKLVVQQEPATIGKRLGEANDALKQSIQVFASRLQKSKKEYPLANMENFVSEFRTFVRWDEHFTHSRPVEDWVALLKVFKEITVSPLEPDVIHEDDWTPLLQAMSGWYLSYLQYEVGIRGQRFYQGVGLQNSLILGDEFFAMTTAAVKVQPSKTITFEQLDRLVSSLHSVGWIPENIRVTSVDQALTAFVTRVAGDPSVSPKDRSSDGVDLMTVANLESAFYRWAYVQFTLDGQYHGETPLSVDQAVPNLQSRLGISDDVRAKLNSYAGSEWNDFIKVKSKIHPLFPERQSLSHPLVPEYVDRVELVPDSEDSQYGLQHGFYNLSMMNVLRSLVALVIRGYSETDSGRELWSSGIQAPELQQFYVDVRELGIDFGWIDKRNSNAGNRAFLEGKLFTSSSTGLDYDPSNPNTGSLGFVEAMEYFAYLYSGGFMADEIFNDLSNICAHGPLDINSIPKVARSCVVAQMPSLIANHMGNMPNLLGYLQNSTADVRHAYGEALLQTATTPLSDSNWVEKNEISTMAVIAHYAESVMTRFDNNQDGMLSNDEIENAVPIFRGLIKKIAKEKFNSNLSDREARGAFLFILNYKTIPGSFMDLAYIWKDELWTPTISLDRYQLALVFQAIVAKLLEVGKSTMPAIIPSPILSTESRGGDSVLLKPEPPADAVSVTK